MNSGGQDSGGFTHWRRKSVRVRRGLPEEGAGNWGTTQGDRKTGGEFALEPFGGCRDTGAPSRG